MTYYEELGLSPSASAEEIRHAHKNIARLLHPDQCRTENLRRVAECQMKRLNALCAVLTDPGERRNYDRSLAAAKESRYGRVLRTAAAWVSARRAWWWVAAGAITMAALSAYLAGHSGPVNNRVAAAPAEMAVGRSPAGAPPSSSDLARDLARLRRQLETVRAERNAAWAELAWLRARASPTPRQREQAPSDRRAPHAVPEPPELAASALAFYPAADIPLPRVPPAPGPSPLVGTWFYAQPKAGAAPSSLYPPEFIEAVILEEAGDLRGKYHARYRVSDRAISPEVQFQFQGPPDQETARLQWTARGGTRGEVRLKLLSENSLEVNWSVTELGNWLGLGSGTAVLTRRQER